VRRHHAKGLLDTQVKGTAHAPGVMSAEGEGPIRRTREGGVNGSR
jgi:hypothetical protein